MGFTLESFASDVQRILKEDPSPAGREKVRALVEAALKDEKFIATLRQRQHTRSADHL